VGVNRKEIDELIEEWTPEPLVEAPTELEQSYINKIPVISGYVHRKCGR
jgi:serine palmitoyltransferase